MINVLFAATDENWDAYRPALTHAFDQAGITADLRQDFAPQDVDYIIYSPKSALRDFAPFSRAKAVLSLWAGVESIVGNDTLRIPLCRMVDFGLTQGMIEWVTGHVLRYHLNIDHALAHQSGDWVKYIPPLARDRKVTLLGLGALGAACAQTLAGLGFTVTGWSRSPKTIDNIRCLSGDDGLKEALRSTEILVLLLPMTPSTENLLDAQALSLLPRGARLLNPGRGPLIDDTALLSALDSGQVGHATLDVFRVEPLPADHPYWAHPKVTVTPHIASETRTETAAEVIAENIRRGEAGEGFLHLVDPTLGY